MTADDCEYTCAACSLPTCRDAAPSPGEADGICADCWATEDAP